VDLRLGRAGGNSELGGDLVVIKLAQVPKDGTDRTEEIVSTLRTSDSLAPAA
jgi:hypothetical protein